MARLAVETMKRKITEERERCVFPTDVDQSSTSKSYLALSTASQKNLKLCNVHLHKSLLWIETGERRYTNPLTLGVYLVQAMRYQRPVMTYQIQMYSPEVVSTTRTSSRINPH